MQHRALRGQAAGALQVPLSLVVPAARALVVFTSDEAVQAAGFEATWDPGPFCAPSTTLVAVSGVFSDGAPPGAPYRSRPAQSAKRQAARAAPHWRKTLA